MVFEWNEFKDIVTSLSTRSEPVAFGSEPVAFTELHSMLLSHEFLHGDALHSIAISNTTDLPSTQPTANIAQHDTDLSST